MDPKNNKYHQPVQPTSANIKESTVVYSEVPPQQQPLLTPQTNQTTTPQPQPDYFSLEFIQKYVPKVNKDIGLLCLIVNLIIPGLGTIIGAVYATDNNPNRNMIILIGVVQLLLYGVGGIGFIWALIWSILMLID